MQYNLFDLFWKRLCEKNSLRVGSSFSFEKEYLKFRERKFKIEREERALQNVYFHKHPLLEPEHSENSRSRKFSWELGSFFLEVPSRNMRWKKISRSRFEISTNNPWWSFRLDSSTTWWSSHSFVFHKTLGGALD